MYSAGTSEGQQASDYFGKWNWYATWYELAKGNILKMEKIGKMNIHEIHLFLAHKIDRAKLKSKLRQGKNVKEL